MTGTAIFPGLFCSMIIFGFMSLLRALWNMQFKGSSPASTPAMYRRLIRKMP